jgi:hypothetical protein
LPLEKGGSAFFLFFSKVWGEIRDILSLGEYVALKGSIDPAGDRNPQKPSLKVSSVADIVALSRSAARKARAGAQPQVPAMQRRPARTALETEQIAPVQAIHIRLDSEAARRDQGIMPLRNYLSGNTGPCPVFIHLADGNGNGNGNGEKIIRAAVGLSLEAEKEALGVLEGCVGVLEAWRE